LAFACACLALAIGAASASAAASWLPPTDISSANELIDGRPKVAVDPAGNAVAIWERHVGGEQVIEASERPGGGEWSTPEKISSANEEGRESQVAIDAAGNAYAVWVEEGASLTSVIRSAVRPLGGEWSVPENLSPPFQGGNPQVALAAAAGAVAAWTIDDGDDMVVQAAVRPAGGEWSDPKDLSDVSADAGPPDEEAGSPDVGINAAGEAVAVWLQFDGSNDIVQAAALPAGGEWSEPEDLSEAGENAHEPQVAIDPDGDAVATWNRWGGSALIVQAAVRAAGDWSEPEDLSEMRLPGEVAPVAIDAAGNAVAVWVHPDDGHHINRGILQAAVLPAGGEWSEPEDLSPPGLDQAANNPAVATNGAVGAVALWRQNDGGEYRVQASVRPPGGEWSEPEDLSAAGEDADLPDLALDAAGNGIAVFGRNGVDGPLVQATGYDFVGPRLSDLRIPATGTVGEPVTFGVSSFDLFPLATSWTFGDGGPGAGGNTVSHAYTAPGTYPVTVSAVDSGGNTSVQTGSIAIAAAKPPPPRRQIVLALRIEGESLRKLRRTGTLRVAASVNEAASVALSGRAELEVRRARGGTRTKLVQVFAPKTVRLAAATEGKVTLALSKRGRKALRSLSRVRLLIAGEARDGTGGTAAKTVAQTLR
jgi:hypothetical protein